MNQAEIKPLLVALRKRIFLLDGVDPGDEYTDAVLLAVLAEAFIAGVRSKLPHVSDRNLRTAAGVRFCVSCDCTEADCSGCIKKTGSPCHWVSADLCSACVKTA